MKKIFEVVLQPINVTEEIKKKTFEEDLHSQHVSGETEAISR